MEEFHFIFPLGSPWMNVSPSKGHKPLGLFEHKQQYSAISFTDTGSRGERATFTEHEVMYIVTGITHNSLSRSEVNKLTLKSMLGTNLLTGWVNFYFQSMWQIKMDHTVMSDSANLHELDFLPG